MDLQLKGSPGWGVGGRGWEEEAACDESQDLQWPHCNLEDLGELLFAPLKEGAVHSGLWSVGASLMVAAHTDVLVRRDQCPSECGGL